MSIDKERVAQVLEGMIHQLTSKEWELFPGDTDSWWCPSCECEPSKHCPTHQRGCRLQLALRQGRELLAELRRSPSTRPDQDASYREAVIRARRGQWGQ